MRWYLTYYSEGLHRYCYLFNKCTTQVSVNLIEGLSSSALSQLTRCSCVEDAIWSTRGLVTLTEEASSRLASQSGFTSSIHLACGLGELGCLYFADYICVPLSQE